MKGKLNAKFTLVCLPVPHGHQLPQPCNQYTVIQNEPPPGPASRGSSCLVKKDRKDKCCTRLSHLFHKTAALVYNNQLVLKVQNQHLCTQMPKNDQTSKSKVMVCSCVSVGSRRVQERMWLNITWIFNFLVWQWTHLPESWRQIFISKSTQGLPLKSFFFHWETTNGRN